MDLVLNIVLTALAVAAIWLVVEVALTVRKARPVLDSVQKTVDEARPVVAEAGSLVEQAKPVLAQVGEVVEGARPGVARLDPVLVQTTEAIGALTGNLEHLDAILGDVSRISKSAGNATVAVGDAAGTLATKARVLFAKGRTSPVPAVPAAAGAEGQVLPEPEPTEAPSEPAVSDAQASQPAGTVCEESGYFTYPQPKE